MDRVELTIVPSYILVEVDSADSKSKFVVLECGYEIAIVFNINKMDLARLEAHFGLVLDVNCEQYME
jgi:hypothetical protein